MKTKVVEFINRIQDGGAETLIKDYALLLDKDKFDVTVLCCFVTKNSSIYKTLTQNNIKVIQMYNNCPNTCRALSRVFKKFNSKLLSKYIRLFKPDVLHVHLEMLETVYYSRKELENVKVVYTCHNLPKTLIGEDLPSEQKACEFLIKHNNLQILALHDDMAKEINDRFDINNTKVIRNGIDLNRFRNISKSKKEIRKKLNIPSNAYVIGSVGRLSYQKNPEFVIKVFNEVVKKNNNSFLLMVGHGKQKQEIEEMINNYKINNKVLLLSHRDDMPELFKAMDVFIFPSRYEGLGIVLIEAQASGVNCVSSNNIPHEAYQSNLITELSLEDSLDKWADACLKPICNISKYGDINNYDMFKEIKLLEDVYKKDIN